MKNRVHYGEFTLEYWIEQLLSGHIELPEYQRAFVWSKDQIRGLIDSIGKDLFVPPITLGKLGDKNIIIDGQQRLTSIALAYFNIIPAERKFKRVIKNVGEIEDDEIEEEHYYEWTIDFLRQLGSGVSTIKSGLVDNGDYEVLGITWVDDEYLKKHYLGFSYIIPNNDSSMEDRHTFFSSIFRNVNIGGTPLLKTESRKSLYYLKPAFVPLFDPEFAKTIVIKQFGGEPQPLDFLRQLALTFDYAKDEDSKKVMKGYKSKSEQYYEIYMSEMINPPADERVSLFKKLRDVMPLEDIEPNMERLKDEILKVSIPNEINSVIEIDMFMFGLIFWILIKHKYLTTDQDLLQNLRERLNSKIHEFKADPAHSKSPATLKFLRKRISTSIEIYQDFVV